MVLSIKLRENPTFLNIDGFLRPFWCLWFSLFLTKRFPDRRPNHLVGFHWHQHQHQQKTSSGPFLASKVRGFCGNGFENIENIEKKNPIFKNEQAAAEQSAPTVKSRPQSPQQSGPIRQHNTQQSFWSRPPVIPYGNRADASASLVPPHHPKPRTSFEPRKLRRRRRRRRRRRASVSACRVLLLRINCTRMISTPPTPPPSPPHHPTSPSPRIRWKSRASAMRLCSSPRNRSARDCSWMTLCTKPRGERDEILEHALFRPANSVPIRSTSRGKCIFFIKIRVYLYIETTTRVCWTIIRIRFVPSRAAERTDAMCWCTLLRSSYPLMNLHYSLLCYLMTSGQPARK